MSSGLILNRLSRACRPFGPKAVLCGALLANPVQPGLAAVEHTMAQREGLLHDQVQYLGVG